MQFYAAFQLMPLLLYLTHCPDESLRIVSKDEDFARRRNASISGPPIVWVRLPNRTRAKTMDWFQKLLPQIMANLERGEPVVAVI
jgi:predicted nuclease of predicted toxin-antitoxin system